MPIIRCDHDEHSAFMVNRCTAQNKALSYEALGMLTYLLSQADSWVIGVDDLKRAGCGRDKAYHILKELENAGHLVHVRNDAKQHLPPVWGERTVYESPFTEKPDMVANSSPDTDFTESGISGNGAPIPEKPDMAKRSEQPTHTSAGKELLKASTQEQVLKDKNTTTTTTNAGAREAEIAIQRASRLWGQEVGVLTPFIRETLLDWLKHYPAGWVEDAIREARLSTTKAIAPKYVQAILDRWLTEGRNAPRPASVSAKPLVRGSPPPNGNGSGKREPTIPLYSKGVPLDILGGKK